MLCDICNSTDSIYIGNLKPYLDSDWDFEIYDCPICGVRYAEKLSCDMNDYFHSKMKNSIYYSQYQIANRVKYYLEKKQIVKCEKYLRSKSTKLDYILTYLSKLDKNANILELGCSTGYIIAFLRAKGYNKAIGIDISNHAIDFAKEKFGQYYYTVCNNQKYDFIFHLGLIGCVSNPKTFLDDYLLKLSKDGIMLFNAPNSNAVKEMDELWVNTPPPNLNYLFKEETFNWMYDANRYTLNIIKINEYHNILKKNLCKFTGRWYTNFPKNLIGQNDENYSFIKSFYYILVNKITELALKYNLIRFYSDEYGLMVKIMNKGLL